MNQTDAATFAICRRDGPAVEQPDLCQKCAHLIPWETGGGRALLRHDRDRAAATDLEPTLRRVRSRQRPLAESAASVETGRAATRRAPAPPPRAAAPPPHAPTLTWRRALPTDRRRALRPSDARRSSGAPADAARTRVVGHSVGRRSVWQSLHLSGRDGAHCAFALGAYVLLAMVFLAIGYRPMGPKAWAISTFVVLQGLAALLVGAAHYVNRRGLVAETERALLWIAAPLFPCVAFNASVVTMHSTVGGVVATLFVVAGAFVLHRRLALELGSGPGRALLVAATGLLATTGLAPLLGAFPPLVACAVAVLLWTGRVFVTKAPEAVAATGEGAEPASTRNGMVLETCALLLLSAFTATVSLTRGARYYGAAALPVWGMFLSSPRVICKGWCAS
jgi:hypothetical protein